MKTKLTVIVCVLALLLGVGVIPASAQQGKRAPALAGYWKGTGHVLGSQGPFEINLLPNGQYLSRGVVGGTVIEDAGTWFVTVDGVLSTFSTVYGVPNRATVTWIGPNQIRMTGINTGANLYRVR